MYGGGNGKARNCGSEPKRRDESLVAELLKYNIHTECYARMNNITPPWTAARQAQPRRSNPQ